MRPSNRPSLVAGLLMLTALVSANGPAIADELPVFPMPQTSGFIPITNVVDARFSGDGTVLWATNQVQLKAWDVASGKLIRDEGTRYQRTWSEAGTVINLQFNGSLDKNSVQYIPAVNRDGTLVSLTHMDANLKLKSMLWDADARTLRHVGTFGEIKGFAPDSSVMVVLNDGKVETRDPVTGALDRVLLKEENAGAVMTADGTFLGVFAGRKSLIYTWPWDKPVKNKGNDERRFNFDLGEYINPTVSQNMQDTNTDRTLQLRRAAWQQESAGIWRNTYQVERADGTVLSTYVTTDQCRACAIVGNTGLWAMLTGNKVRLISIDSGDVVREYALVEDTAAFNRLISTQLLAARNQQSANAGSAADALASRIENRPTQFKQFLINFEPLPDSWVLDYNALRGRDITHHAWVGNSFGTFFGGQTFNALGKIADCTNGSVALLTLTRSQRNGADTSLFQIAVFDADGKLAGNHEIGTTQKDSSGQPLVVAFAMSANAQQARFDIRQSRWDGDKTRSLNVDKNNCSVR